MSKPLICEPRTWNFTLPIKKTIQSHDIRDQNVSKNLKFAVNPCTHNCTEVCFEYCTFYEFPSASSIIDHCPQITTLVIQTSKLSRIEAEDLKGFKCLKDLRIVSCEIEHLPGDLFKYTPNLENIIFYGNKIKSVGENLLTPLESLKYFDLRSNPGIDYCFSSIKNQGTLKELKEKLKEMKSNSKLLKEIEALKKQVQQLQEAAMNCVVKVNGKEFKAQKHVLKAHSKVFEKLIDQNPDIKILELAKLSAASFAEINNFIHHVCPPNEDVDLVELFNASCRLEIEALTPIVVKILQVKVNPENALEILFICNKFGDHEQLKMKAFDEFKKNIPHYTIDEELRNDPEKLKQILKTKLEMDKLVANN